ncbi:GNAT family N-acetyltransferase [Reinekea marinisedimentorum]|uniref:Ribosomal-protein-serine acetyltransferase n=1 Tax=Reinekea marinisedimentorum TaxID=230495 RepID=A0A4R3I6B5_9GAMM|nr:GNAT family protein [Reinekea marinisedimentorum]TCS40702.1 ribosomal-protein-serine acetyltransferase [Reinekea marinisedimentorum]
MPSCSTEINGLKLLHANPCYAHDVFATVADNRSYLRQWLPWVDPTQTVEDTRLFLATCQQKYAMQKQFTTLMYLHGQFIGIAGYNDLNHANHTGEIGYWMAMHCQGKGFMSAAVRKIIELGFNNFDLNRQVIRAAVDNKPSRAVAERLGFTYEGVERQSANLNGRYLDMAVYSLLKQEWLEQQPED